MGNIIHMDTEEVRGFTVQMDQTIAQMSEVIGNVYRQIQSVGWQGPGRDEFEQEFGIIYHHFNDHFDLAHILNQRVRAEVDEWIGVDAAGAAHFQADAQLGIRSPGFAEGWDDFWSSIFPPSIDSGIRSMLETEAGKQLIEDAKKAKVRFKVKGGGTYGYEGSDGKEIEIDFGNTNSAGGTYLKDKITVSDAVMQRLLHSRDSMGSLIGHEMQHALDDAQGLMSDSVKNEEFKNYATMNPQQQEEFRTRVSRDAQAWFDTEIRAYERSDAITSHQAYTDDGINTASERQAALDHPFDAQDYEAYYEKALAEQAPNCEFDVYVDNQGQIKVNINVLPPPPAQPVPMPAPTPAPSVA